MILFKYFVCVVCMYVFMFSCSIFEWCVYLSIIYVFILYVTFLCNYVYIMQTVVSICLQRCRLSSTDYSSTRRSVVEYNKRYGIVLVHTMLYVVASTLGITSNTIIENTIGRLGDRVVWFVNFTLTHNCGCLSHCETEIVLLSTTKQYVKQRLFLSL